jgi:hypothetical protein
LPGRIAFIPLTRPLPLSLHFLTGHRRLGTATLRTSSRGSARACPRMRLMGRGAPRCSSRARTAIWR